MNWTPTQWIILIYLFFTFVRYFTSFGLNVLNMGHILKNRDCIPSIMNGVISQEEYKQSQFYSMKKGGMALLSLTLNLVIILTLIYGGILGKLDTFTESFGLSVFWHGFLYLSLLTLLMELLGFPLSFYNQFVLEEEFGFNKLTLKLFISDNLKQGLLSLLISLPLLALLYWFLDKTGDRWWIFAWGGFIVVQLFLFFIYPVVIAPLFNKFTPLEEGELKERLNELANKTGFANKGIFVMDGSKRSSHSNAYFTGMGRFRRIVLFDTLIEQLEIKELEAVLAHEIGHFKKKHVLKRMIGSLLIVGAGFFLLDLLMNWEPLYLAFHFQKASLHALLVILMFCSSPFTFLITPLSSSRSRKQEFEADRYSRDVMESPFPIITALQKLSQKNLSNLTPHPLYSNFYYSHPTLSERKEALVEA